MAYRRPPKSSKIQGLMMFFFFVMMAFMIFCSCFGEISAFEIVGVVGVSENGHVIGEDDDKP